METNKNAGVATDRLQPLVSLWCPDCDYWREHEMQADGYVAECTVCYEPHDTTEEERQKIKKANDNHEAERN